MKNFLLGIVVGSVGYWLVQNASNQPKTRRRPTDKPKEVARWEDEGGNVPGANLSTAPQVLKS